MKSLLSVVVVALVSTGQATLTMAQPAASDLFDQSVEVRVVNVDVHVTDRKGRPITGLGKDDFELYVDGLRVEIGYFSAAEGRREAPSAEVDTAPAVAGSPTERTVPIRQADDLLVVLYLDHNWLKMNDRLRLLDDLEQFVAAQTTSAMRFLVVTSDPGLNIRSPITTNLATIRETLTTLSDLPTRGDDHARERSTAFRDIASIYQVYEHSPWCTPCDCGWGQMLAAWEAFAQRVTSRMEVTAGGLSDLLAALSGMPGRKAVLYVAGGLEQRPAFDVLQYLGEICPVNERDAQTRMFFYDESGLLRKLGALANASRVTFYPLDSGGLRGEGSASVEWADSKFRPSGLVTRIERENYQASLQILATETGGQAIFNANHPLEQLRRLETDFDFVYSLGYEPTLEADGKSHKLRVELRDKGRNANLRFRRAFIDRPLDQRLVNRAIAAITFGEERNPLAVEASLGAPVALARNAVSLPVHVAVRPERLTLVATADGILTGRFRVFLAARSPNGARTVLREKFFDVGPEEAAQGVMRLIVTMNLEPDDYTVVVGVRDEIGQETSYVTLETRDPADQLVEVTPAAES